MGRTIPSFHIASVVEEKEWKSFKNSLDKSDRQKIDEMFSIAGLYNSASSYAANPIQMRSIFMSIIFYHYKQLVKLSEETGSPVMCELKPGESKIIQWDRKDTEQNQSKTGTYNARTSFERID